VCVCVQSSHFLSATSNSHRRSGRDADKTVSSCPAGGVNGASERARTLTAAGDRVPVESELGDTSERREHASQLWFGDVGRQLSDEQLTSTPSCVQPRRCRRRRQPTTTPAAAAAASATYTTGTRTGRKTVPIQFAQCWFPRLAIFSVLKYEYIFQIFN